VHNGTLRYQSTRDRQDVLRRRLCQLAAVRVRFGYRRLTVLLQREGCRAKRETRLPPVSRGRTGHPHHTPEAAGESGPRAAAGAEPAE